MKQLSYIYKTIATNSAPKHQFTWYEESGQALTPSEYTLLSTLQANCTELVSRDKLFFSKTVDYPRFKFRDWGKDQKIAISQSTTTATAIVIDLTKLRDLLEFTTEYQVHKYQGASVVLESHYRDVEAEGTIYVREELDNISGNPLFGRTSIQPVSMKMHFFQRYRISQSDLESLEQLIDFMKARPNVKIIDFPIFRKQVASDTVMDGQKFWSVYEMISSDDPDTNNLGSEVLTNINIDKSQFFINLMFISNGDMIYNSNIYNKVTMKPIRNYLDSIGLRSWQSKALDKPGSDKYNAALKQVIDLHKTNNTVSQIDQSFMKSVIAPSIITSFRDTMAGNFGIILEDISFELDPLIYPRAQNKYFAYVNEEPSRRPQLGKNLPKHPEEDLPEYSDEPVGVSEEGQSED